MLKKALIHEESCKKGQAFPIIPVVFYHGKTPWKWAKSFQDIIYKGFLRKTPVRLRRNMINYEIRLLDVYEPKSRPADNIYILYNSYR